MALTGWSAANFLVRSSQVYDTLPFALSVWFYRDNNITATFRFMGAVGTDGSTNNRHDIGLNGTQTMRADSIDTAADTASGTVAADAITWTHGFAEFIATNDRAVSLNGADRQTNTGTATPTTTNKATIGVVGNNANPFDTAGALAEFSIWDTSGMTPTDRTDLRDKLSAGENPLTIDAESAQPWTGKLVAYWPLPTSADLADASGNGHDMTMQGTLTTFGSHPPVDAAEDIPSLVGASAVIAVTATSAANLTPAFPAGYTAVADDIAVVLVHHSANGPFNTPSNYDIATDGVETLNDNNTSAQRVTVFWERFVGGESAPTLILTTNNVTTVRGAILLIIRGCRTTGIPFEVCKRLLNAAAATISFPAVTTTIANALLLALGAYEDDPSARTTPTDWTPGTVYVSATGTDMSLNYFTRLLAAAGTAIAFSTTVSGGTFANSPSVGAVLAFVPPSSGPTDDDSLAMMPSRQLIMWP